MIDKKTEEDINSICFISNNKRAVEVFEDIVTSTETSHLFHMHSSTKVVML